jgi:xanthine dehydrogenase accessory factor
LTLDLESAFRGASRTSGAVAIVVAAKGSRAGVGSKLVLDRQGAVTTGDRLGKELEARLQDEARQVIESAEARLVSLEDESCGGRVTVYIEPAAAKGEVLVLGASPVADAVARIASAAGFAVTVHAPGASRERFSTARDVVSESYGELEPPAPGVHVVVSTAHEDDEGALKAALAGRPASVQLVASSKRARAILATLEKDRVARDRLKTIRSPAGLDLGAESPEEIAVSIVAEIVALRRGGSFRPLVDVKGPGSTTTADDETKTVPRATKSLGRPAPEKPEPEKPAPEKPKRRLKVDGDEEDFRPTSRLPMSGVAGADEDDLRPDVRTPDDDEMVEPKLRRREKKPEPLPAPAPARKTGRVTSRKHKMDVEIIDFRPKDADEPDEFRGGGRKK